MSLIGNKLLDKVSDFNSLSKEFALKCIVIYTYFVNKYYLSIGYIAT